MPALWHSSEVLAATAGRPDAARPDEAWTASGLSIDSRTLLPGDLFIAIKGVRHDGHDFISEAFKNGAAAVIAEHIQNPADRLVKVKDSHQALIALAAAARARSNARIMAITGSVGKTAVKDGLNLALAAKGAAVHAAAGSLNNQWGVPLALARMKPDSDFGVFEIGMNHAGEISPLARLVEPDLVIITGIAEAHLAFFKTLREIAEAKAEIFDGLKKGGNVLLNHDGAFYDFLSDQAHKKGAGRVVSFGTDEQCPLRLMDMDITSGGAHVRARIFGADLSFHLFLPARAMALNALAILGAVHLMDGDVAQAAQALSGYRPRSGRGARIKIKIAGKPVTLIDESYNANPSSMRAAFEILGNLPCRARRIAILGDMHELGQDEVDLHKALSDPLQASADLVFACGEKMKYLYDVLPGDLRGGYAATCDALIPVLKEKLRDDVREGDILMVKASRASGLDLIVAAFKDEL